MESLLISESLKSIMLELPMSTVISGLSGPVGGGGLEYAAINWVHDTNYMFLKNNKHEKQQNTSPTCHSSITGYVGLVISRSFCFALRSASLASFRSCFRWSASFNLSHKVQDKNLTSLIKCLCHTWFWLGKYQHWVSQHIIIALKCSPSNCMILTVHFCHSHHY